jgi:hypothetical protein
MGGFAHFDIKPAESKVDEIDEWNFGHLFQHSVCQNSAVGDD